MKTIRSFGRIIKKAFLSFLDDNAFKLSASLSYYTLFAIGPLLIIVISLAGIFFAQEAVQGKLYGQIKDLIGSNAALEVQMIIRHIREIRQSRTGAIIGFIILFVGATGVFTEIQGSINYIWSVRAKPEKGWLKYIVNRLLSFSLVVAMGFLLLVSLSVNALLELLSDRLIHYFHSYAIEVFYVLNLLFILIVICCLFAVIFRVLPDAHIQWKDAFVGAAFTSILFLLGKFLIGYYLGNSNIGLTYGAAASVVVLLVWVYYSSIILYFGAEFTRIYAIERGAGIKPSRTAVFIVRKETREVPASSLDT